MASLLDLPPELVIRILLYMSLQDVGCCQLSNSFLCLIITNSPEIQYHLATLIAGVENNDQFELGIHERIERLRSRERGWEELKFEFSQEIQIVDSGYGVYDILIEGLYFRMCTWGVNDASRYLEEICYFKMPSKPGEDIHLDKIYFPGPYGVLAMAVAAYEHDLLAVVTL